MHKLGDENKASFWHDRWCTEIPLKSLFLDAFEAARNKKAVVKEYWGRAR